MLLGATTKIRGVILDFDMLSEIITFESKAKIDKLEKLDKICDEKNMQYDIEIASLKNGGIF